MRDESCTVNEDENLLPCHISCGCVVQNDLTYIAIWKLADYLQMPKLQSFVISHLCDEYDFINTQWIAELWAGGHAHFEKESTLNKVHKYLCNDFLVDVPWIRTKTDEAAGKHQGVPKAGRYFVDEKGNHVSKELRDKKTEIWKVDPDDFEVSSDCGTMFRTDLLTKM